MTTNKALDIYVNDDLAGKLWLENKEFCFQYSDEWVNSRSYGLSLSLPVKKQPYLNNSARAFFTNLLPEGRVRDSVEERRKITKGDDFALLAGIGGECAGAVIVMPEGTKPTNDNSYEMIPESQIGRFIEKIRISPFLADIEEVRLSLAGAQVKMPIVYDGVNIGVTKGNTPSTHILKPQSLSYKHLVENETFMMQLANRVGLNVPKVDILKYEDQSAYIIERYDRITVDGKIKRLMQEDFCQIMNLSSEDKYNAEKGSTFASCYKIILDNSTNSFEDRIQFLKWIAFNALTGNEDAHAKNISILYSPEGIKLSPFYDIVNTYTYPFERGSAMNIGKESRILIFVPAHFEQLAIELGIKKDMIHDINKDMIEKLDKETQYCKKQFVERYGPNSKVNEIESLIYKSISKLDREYKSFELKPSKFERQELDSFVSTITKIYPNVNPENLHKLCTIASDMQKYTIQNTNGSLSAEKFNSLTDQQEKQIQELIKDLPGVKINLPYEPTSAAITIDIPAQPGCLKSITCNVPEIPKNKLTIAPVPTKTATEIVSKKR